MPIKTSEEEKKRKQKNQHSQIEKHSKSETQKNQQTQNPNVVDSENRLIKGVNSFLIVLFSFHFFFLYSFSRCSRIGDNHRHWCPWLQLFRTGDLERRSRHLGLGLRDRKTRNHHHRWWWGLWPWEKEALLEGFIHGGQRERVWECSSRKKEEMERERDTEKGEKQERIKNR